MRPYQDARGLFNKAISLLQIILTKAPLAIAHSIIAANAAATPEGYLTELEAFGECFATEDMKEGTAAFLEKRKPVFKGL